MDPLTKLYRIRKTVHEMLKARNYVVSVRELNRTKEEARAPLHRNVAAAPHRTASCARLARAHASGHSSAPSPRASGLAARVLQGSRLTRRGCIAAPALAVQDGLWGDAQARGPDHHRAARGRPRGLGAPLPRRPGSAAKRQTLRPRAAPPIAPPCTGCATQRVALTHPRGVADLCVLPGGGEGRREEDQGTGWAQPGIQAWRACACADARGRVRRTTRSG